MTNYPTDDPTGDPRGGSTGRPRAASQKSSHVPESSHAGPGRVADFSEEVRQATARAEEELQRLIRYLNDAVVPDVRRHSSSALHAAADGLRKLAQKMDDRRP